MTTDGIEVGLIGYLDVALQAEELSAKTALNMGMLRFAEKLEIVLRKRETAREIETCEASLPMRGGARG